MSKTYSITYKGIIVKPDNKSLSKLKALMRKFQSAKRYSYKRILEGLNRKEVVSLTKPIFINNSRYMRDAHLEAKAAIESQKELLPLYIEELTGSIKKVKKKINRLKRSKNRYKNKAIAHKRNKLRKLTKKLKHYEYLLENNKTPKIVFGSKKLLRKLNKGKVTKQEWRNARSNAIWARGERSKGGNENIKLSYIGDNLFKARILNALSNKRGDRIVFKVRFPDKFTSKLIKHLSLGEAYSVRVIKKKKQIEVHVSIAATPKSETNFTLGCAGIDINVDNISVTIANSVGNYIASKMFWMHELNTVGSNKRKWIIPNTVKEAINWVKEFNVDAVAIEKLKFLRDYTNTRKKNRATHNFMCRQIGEKIVLRCFKENISLLQVSAYYSSFIGKAKYQKRYGLSTHQAAALVLARRAMNYDEKIPKNILITLFPKEGEKGLELRDLKYWKKVHKWFKNIIKEEFKKGVYIKGRHFDAFLQKAG
jgi:predicted transposase